MTVNPLNPLMKFAPGEVQQVLLGADRVNTNGYANILPNAGDSRGFYGWRISKERAQDNAAMDLNNVNVTSPGVMTAGFRLSVPIAGALGFAWSVPIDVAPGIYYGLAVRLSGVSKAASTSNSAFQGILMFYDATGAAISGGDVTGSTVTATTANVGSRSIAFGLSPAGAVTAQLRVTWGPAISSVGDYIDFSDPIVYEAGSTAPTTASQPFVRPNMCFDYTGDATDVFPAASEMVVVRPDGLQASQITLTYRHEGPDSTVFTRYGVGRSVHWKVTPTGRSTFTAFYGRVTDVRVAYTWNAKTLVYDQTTTVVAEDIGVDLANYTVTTLYGRTTTTTPLQRLMTTVDSSPIPLNLAGNTNAPPAALGLDDIFTSDSPLKVTDVIPWYGNALSRSTYIEQTGRVAVADAPIYTITLDDTSSTPSATTNRCSHIELGVNKDAIVNQVQVNELGPDANSKMQTVAAGPYRARSSSRKLGNRLATVAKIARSWTTGVDDPATTASRLLTAKATPATVASRVTVPVHDATWDVQNMAQLVGGARLSVAASGLMAARQHGITQVTHTITPDEWLCDLELDPYPSTYNLTA